jgi:hypothetical protein
MVSVKYEEISMAFEFVSFAAPMEHQAYVCLETGAIYWVSELNPLDEEDVKDDLGESDRYIAIPHKNDLDLGRELALRFVSDELPRQYSRVEDFFRHRRAYARFKDLLAAEGYLDKWYAYESESTEMALRHWCKENDIEVVESDDESTA